jgi:hypothetical protein
MRLDYYRAVRKGMPLVWMFGPGSMTRADVLRHMREALREIRLDLLAGRTPKAEDYTIRLSQEIEAGLEGIVQKRNEMKPIP